MLSSPALSISQRRVSDMNIHRKAPAYKQAKARLNACFAKTGKIPSIRELKAECGGAGSNETYQQYLKRWQAERSQASGTMPGLLALRNQVQANADIMIAIIDQTMQQVARLGLLEHDQAGADDTDLDNTECDGGDPDFDDEDIGSASQARLIDQPTAGDADQSADKADAAREPEHADADADAPVAPAPAVGLQTPSADEITALSQTFAEQAEPLFLEADDEPEIDGSVMPINRANPYGEQSVSRSAPMPIDSTDPLIDDTSLSRFNGGSQQTALPFEPNQPEQGESDSTGGSANGAA